MNNNNKNFLMSVEDVFFISSRGTVVTGRVERGSVKIGDEIEIVGLGKDQKAEVTAIEQFKKSLDNATAGDNVGILLEGIEQKDIVRGQVLAAPGSIKAYGQFVADLQVKGFASLAHMHNFKICSGDKLLLYFRTAEIVATIKLPETTIELGVDDKAKVTLVTELPIAIEAGDSFAVRGYGTGLDGKKYCSGVGSGVVIGVVKGRDSE